MLLKCSWMNENRREYVAPGLRLPAAAFIGLPAGRPNNHALKDDQAESQSPAAGCGYESGSKAAAVQSLRRLMQRRARAH